MEVINFSNPNNKKNKLFFGEQMGIINLTNPKYPIFKTLFKDQLSFFWQSHEVSMARDCADLKSLSSTERFIFENNLYFQTMGDSFLGSGIKEILKYVTNNELFCSLETHAYYESSIHTISYSHAIENIYNDPVEEFHKILENPAILHRAKETTEKFNKLLNTDGTDLRKDVVNTIIGLLALESISFYNSFLTSFYFHKNGKMTGTGSIIKLIARDEHLHKSNCINILKILTREEEEGFTDLNEYIFDKIEETFREMAESEFKWIEYLFSQGELPGLNKELLTRYVKFLTNKSIQDLGLSKRIKIFEETKNPFPWVASYLGSSKNVQVAPQETEIVNYVKSSKNDLDDFQF